MNIVYARRDDLLGGCLMNLAHSWGFAEKLGATLAVEWQDDHPNRPRMPLSDIFQQTDQFLQVRELNTTYVYAMPRTPQWSVSLKNNPIIFYPHTSWVCVDGARKADDEPRIRRLLNSLPIQPAVAWAVEAISARHPKFTAVHLRRGDDILAILRSDDRTEKFDRACSSFVKRYADLETYRRAVDDNGDEDVLIFSNDIVEAECLASGLSKRFVTQVGSLPELDALTPTQRDFAEMLLMSRATKIIGTRSNYSAFPRLLGGIPLILVHRYISTPHLRAAIEAVVPPRAIPAVLDGYNKIISRLAQK